jgi:hypothetical protein
VARPDDRILSAHLVVGVGLAAQAVDLRPAGDARQHVVAPRIARDLLLVFAIVRERVRARADQRHVALDDVDELRQLVDVPFAQGSPETRDARIVAPRLLHHVAVVQRHHGAELDDAEFLLVEAVAPLAEYRRTRRGQLDRHRNDGCA